MSDKTDTSHYEKCLQEKKKLEKHNSLRLFILLCASITNLLSVFGLVNTYGIIAGIVGLLYCIITFVSFLFAAPESPKLCMLSVALVLLGLSGQCIHIAYGLLMLVTLLTLIPDSKKDKWLRNQPGYPHFNRRFDEQMEHFGKEYQSEYQFDNVHDAEMPDVSGEFSDDLHPDDERNISHAE